MSEIEKMYKNAGVEPIAEYCKHQCNNEFDDNACIGCKYIEKVEYPPFTKEKQIELIKFLLKNYEGVDISKKINRFYFLVDNATFAGCRHDDKSFERSLAGVINKLWADMSEEEKQQVKGILE